MDNLTLIARLIAYNAQQRAGTPQTPPTPPIPPTPPPTLEQRVAALEAWRASLEGD